MRLLSFWLHPTPIPSCGRVLLRCAGILLLLLNALGLALVPRVAGAEEPRELRGVWVARFQWRTADDLREMVGNVKAMGGNAIFFQVRGESDAFYRSRHEPWAARLTGTLGRDPGWDPLQLVIDHAHASGLEVHAWLNVYPAWRASAPPPPPSEPEHVLRAHPDWVAVDNAGNKKADSTEYLSLSPGNPAVQQHVLDVVTDVVARYEVDGVHFDYVRYSGRDFSYDAVSNARFGGDNPGRLGRADWQREQVTGLVRRAHSAVKTARPQAQVSAAVWGSYRNVWGWPIKNTGYDTFYQDSRGWLEAGIVDFIVPMTYWRIGGTPDFAATVRDFLGASHGRGVYPGIGLFPNWASWDEVSAQIELARRHGARGVVLFSYPDAIPLQRQLADGPWSGPASTPWSTTMEPATVPEEANAAASAADGPPVTAGAPERTVPPTREDAPAPTPPAALPVGPWALGVALLAAALGLLGRRLLRYLPVVGRLRPLDLLRQAFRRRR